MLNPPLPTSRGTVSSWCQLPGAATALAIAQTAQTSDQLIIVICETIADASRLQYDLRFFHPGELWLFPDWETLPYDNMSPHQDIISNRLASLNKLHNKNGGILLVGAQTLMQKIAPPSYVAHHALIINKTPECSFSNLQSQLVNSSYIRVEQVMEHGEYAVRGEIIDLYPMGYASPLRLDFFDEELETISKFDADSQLSIAELDEVKIMAAREFPLNDDSIALFKQNWQDLFGTKGADNHIYQAVSQGTSPAGIEYYLPLFFSAEATLFDYLPHNSLIINLSNIEDVAQQVIADYQERYEQLLDRQILPPHRLLLAVDKIFGRLKKFPRITIGKEGKVEFAAKMPPSLLINHKYAEPLFSLLEFLAKFDGRVLFALGSAARRQMLVEMLAHRKIRLREVANFDDFISSDYEYAICQGELEQGLLLNSPPLAIICESQLFGEQVSQYRRGKSRKTDTDKIIHNLIELKIDDPIVHIDHGVGRYRGLKTLSAGGQQAEYLIIEYFGADILYVPVTTLDFIHRYTGADKDLAPLHRLGSSQWAKARNKARDKAHDVATELLEIYAKRAANVRTGIDEPGEQYQVFAAEFSFEPTPDQQASIDAIISDMMAEQPMDRLVCGDVGFGKTEVAMRAAFLATNNAKQVAILVPTTLLAQQHYETISNRFADWPINIELLSRFKTPQEIQTAKQNISSGLADIVVGTHRLFSKDIKFKRLGLLIIDEEHRFGVKQKEKFKKLRAQVDMLALTATPIPRTLNLSISGIRDLSIIASPPQNRLAIKTLVAQWDADLIKESCLREIRRGGQVYFVHNKIETIAGIALDLKKLLPRANIAVAHGQMRETELEQIMRDFYHRRYNILLCTTIIENGIDVPTANTIIINRADRLGLAQLYQLRGRVGRSHHRAYAYLLVADDQAVSVTARKRLDAVSSLEELGVGFTLAVQDMEIRGAGELLGEEQSGQINEIGFEMYSKILEQAVNDLKSGRLTTQDMTTIEVDIGAPALIPEDYLPDVNARLVLYKRIANCASEDELENLQIEIIDRFGILPTEVINIFTSAKLKIKLTPYKIKKLEIADDDIQFVFAEKPDIDPLTIIKLIQQNPKKYQMHGQDKFIIKTEKEDKVGEIEAWLGML